ncbi:xanthine dehydrogenase molybdenum binding subunit apoprotein [Neolewinella xylanilytica]|uniref:Xanthine dehydrogenase molybdenum binding subunit apoprotein n=1 Tax=Neolewinella xylanilytica TaxID=1514080 RepID=A0A2S6I5Y2_9BACT|nr:xanthine dehydrogenase family protein molybdopterin-binding subunit [Neolewinella xylanilytica]PPK86573.1 xanthine dehydrogenase molybdenum binding subunit apoprotein [Neolewinella xylanilytica]
MSQSTLPQPKPEIGRPRRRIVGEQKVTGTATYAAEYAPENLLHGYVVNAKITKGRITGIEERAAREVEGVVEIMHHLRRPKMGYFDMQYSDIDAPPGSPFRVFYDANVQFNEQPIALVLADTFEAARYAASLIEVSYEEDPFDVDLHKNLDKARKPKEGIDSILKPMPPDDYGDFDRAFGEAAATYEGEVYHRSQHHNPLEMHATTTVYEGKGKVTVYDKTQGTTNSQMYVSSALGLKMSDVRVIAPFVGGGFGSGLRPQYQVLLSVMAALYLKRNVRVQLDREQMYTFGHRPETLQRVRFGASADGKLTAVSHEAYAETSRFEDYHETVVNHAGVLYPVENVHLDYQLVPLDRFTPLDMRAPGGLTGVLAVETAMDQLADRLQMDPLEFRLKNYAERDQSTGKPFSSKELRACYSQAAERFGWDQRKPTGQHPRRGNRLVGHGMASGIWDAIMLPAKATARLTTEGKLLIQCALNDCGQGAYTVMSQIAADELGLPFEDVTFEYADSKLDASPVQGGSFTTGVVGSAVKAACFALKDKIFHLAQILDGFPLGDALLPDVTFTGGEIVLHADPSVRIPFTEIIAFNKGKALEVSKTNIPNPIKLKRYTRNSHAASFVEVEVDAQLGVVYLTRAVTAVAAGRIMNTQTARSQILGGMVWGISMALREETLLDHNMGKFMNTNLAEYHVPVHADIGELDVIFVEEKDDIVNELGVKGLGEIGTISMAPAIANAIFNATGKVVTQFPFKLGDL